MAPKPDEVDVHHRIAAGVVREEVKAAIPIQQKHREGRRQNRERRDDQEVRCERCPAEHRHARIAHARRAHLQNGGREVYAGQQRSEAGDLQRPKVVVDADPWRIRNFAQRRIRQPTGACELTDEERHVHQQHAGRGQPEAHVVEHGERNVANAELKRHGEIHQTHDERHRHEEDHDRAMRGKYLVVMLGRQVALRSAGRKCELHAHHDRVRKAAHQHHQRNNDVHHADALVVDARDPLMPEIRPPASDRDQQQNPDDRDTEDDQRPHDDRLIEGDRIPGQFA